VCACATYWLPAPDPGAPPAGGLLFEGIDPPFVPAPPGAGDAPPGPPLGGLLPPGRLDGMFELPDGLVADGER
jgi:hypothetical protein